MLRRVAAVLALAALLASPAAGFDTYWHSQCTQTAGEHFGFAEDAWKIMQLGNFSPDFFGPVSQYASQNLNGKQLDVLNHSLANDPRIRCAVIFLHLEHF